MTPPAPAPAAATGPVELVLWLVLKRCRENRCLSQRAAAAKVDVAPPVVSRWESGRVPIGEETLVKFAAAYGLTIRELLLEGLAGPSAARQAAEAEAEQRRGRWAKMGPVALGAKARTADGLRELLADLDARTLGELLGVSRQAIEQRATRLGVTNVLARR